VGKKIDAHTNNAAGIRNYGIELDVLEGQGLLTGAGCREFPDRGSLEHTLQIRESLPHPDLRPQEAAIDREANPGRSIEPVAYEFHGFVCSFSLTTAAFGCLSGFTLL